MFSPPVDNFIININIEMNLHLLINYTILHLTNFIYSRDQHIYVLRK